MKQLLFLLFYNLRVVYAGNCHKYLNFFHFEFELNKVLESGYTTTLDNLLKILEYRYLYNPEPLEESLVTELFFLVNDRPEYMKVLYANTKLSDEEKFNVISYLARIYNTGLIKDLKAYNKLVSAILEENTTGLRDISIKYDSFRRLLLRAQHDKLYRIFGGLNNSTEAVDTSITYLDLLARKVLYEFYENLRNQNSVDSIINTLKVLGGYLQEFIIEKYPFLGAYGRTALARENVGSLRFKGNSRSVSILQDKFGKDIDIALGNAKYTLKVRKAYKISYIYLLDNKEIPFNKLKTKDQELFKALITISKKHLESDRDYPFDLCYLTPNIHEGKIYTTGVRLLHNSKKFYKLIHTTPEQSLDIINTKVSKLFDKLLKGKYYKNSEYEFNKDLASVYWYLIQAMPYYRGSASLIDVFVKGLVMLDMEYIPIFSKRLDLPAYSTSLREFIAMYKTFVSKNMSVDNYLSLLRVKR